MDAVRKILKSNYVDGVFHTHISMVQPRGRFQFNRQTLEEFWKDYCNAITTDPNLVFGIGEKPQSYMPVLADIDLKIRDEGDPMGDSLYSEEQMLTVVQTYQSVLRQIVENCTDQELICVVLEKKMYQQTKNEVVYFKHGFHLHFPYCFLSRENQEVQLIPRVQDSIRDCNLFSNLGIEDSGMVVDKACCTVSWLLYGSRKSEEAQPYVVTKIFNSELKLLSLEKAFKNYQLFDDREKQISIAGKVKEYLPRILSIVSANRATKELKLNLISPLKEKNKAKNKERDPSINHRNIPIPEALEIAKKLLPMLADFRAEQFDEWMSIGWILWNISEGHSDGLDLWCEFSSRCEEKYDENSCIYHWERMVQKNYTLGTLFYFAKIDNPVEYNKFKENNSKQYIESSLDGSHNDVAKALYAQYGDEFVCGSVANKIWFQFIGHKWEQIEEGVFLREKISGRLVQKYYDAVKSLYNELKDCQDKAKETMINARIKQVGKMISNLKSSPFKSNVMKEAQEVFYDPRFRDKLDADPHLAPFKNGVYDLKLNIFRHGRPEDFISKCMPINYIEYTDDDEMVQEVHTFLEQIFPDKSLRKYFLDISSDVFVGGNHEKTVVFWVGDGDNGKSIVQKFFDLMLGQLCVKLNTNIITGKKPAAGSAFADLARTGGGVRWAVLEEPDGDEAINIGIFKHLSGGDSYYARDLFERGKDGREIIPMFKLTFICNKLPRMKYADNAVWNRVRVLPYESVFCKDSSPAPETYEEQLKQKRFPRDKHFMKKIPNMVSAFAWVLLQHRKNLKVRIEPSKVMEATEKYRKQNDIYKQFMDESIVVDKNKCLSLIELYNIFKDWFRDSLPGHTVPMKNEIEEYFIKIWGTSERGKKWKGYRQRTLQDDIESGNAVVMEPDELHDYDEDKNLPI